jgi:hypothetical protein
MRLRISRKIFILFVLLFFISLLALGGYIYFENTGRTKSAYIEQLESYCETTGSLLKEKMLCKGFMIGELESEESERCFWLLVYDGEGELVDFELCEETKLVDWDNPYGDCEKHVPVLMEVPIRESFLGTSKLKNVKFTLMEDQEIFDILDTLPEDQGRASFFQSQIYIKKYQEVFDKGYYITSPMDSDTKNLLVLHDAKVEEISALEGEVALSINTSIYGEELNLLISTEGFILSDPEAGDGILIDVEGLDAFDYEGDFFVFLSFNLDEREVEEYLKSLSESEEEEIMLKEGFKLEELIGKEIWEE